MNSSPLPTPTSSGSSRLRVLALAVLVLLAMGVVAYLFLYRNPSPISRKPDSLPDPRLEYDGPFQNVRPPVGYVGDAACRDCHPQIAAAYARHPMGRSLTPVHDTGKQPIPDDQKPHFEALGAVFQIERQGKQVRHRMTFLDTDNEPIDSLDFAVDYIVGSGTRGHSYLSDRDGYLFQTPISHFSQKGIWQLSPGFTAEMARGRPISPDCLYCHANRTRPIDGTVNAYRSPPFDGHAIGCERCHGPGELHVRQRSEQVAVGPVDYTIVNPARLAPDLREAVCQQCHLAGEARVVRFGRRQDDFRPGLPLDQFLTILVPDRQQGHRKAVNHVEQMYLSRCFQGSPAEKKLGCISCHDPHERPDPQRQVAFYRDRCLQCHRDKGCSEPREARLKRSQDNCASCHMPRYAASDIPHVAATDHRIVRRPDPLMAGEIDKRFPVPFGRMTSADPELNRDLGIGLAQLARAGKGEPTRFAGRALELLDGDTRESVDDVVAWEARGNALLVLGRTKESLAAYEKALELVPRREKSLRAAALLAQQAGLRDRALTYWQRVVDVNPWGVDYRANLATLLVNSRSWEEAQVHCRAWVRLDPASRPARELWIRCLRQKGDHDSARAQEQILRRLR